MTTTSRQFTVVTRCEVCTGAHLIVACPEMERRRARLAERLRELDRQRGGVSLTVEQIAVNAAIASLR